MDRNTDICRAEKEKQERKLETLLLDRLESCDGIPVTSMDFDEIKQRIFARLKAGKDNPEPAV